MGFWVDILKQIERIFKVPKNVFPFTIITLIHFKVSIIDSSIDSYKHSKCFACNTENIFIVLSAVSVAQPSILFSYKPQVDDELQEQEDNVSLPHQLSCSSLKTDSDYIYQVRPLLSLFPC